MLSHFLTDFSQTLSGSLGSLRESTSGAFRCILSSAPQINRVLPEIIQSLSNTSREAANWDHVGGLIIGRGWPVLANASVEILEDGASRARKKAGEVLRRAQQACGLKCK